MLPTEGPRPPPAGAENRADRSLFLDDEGDRVHPRLDLLLDHRLGEVGVARREARYFGHFLRGPFGVLGAVVTPADEYVPEFVEVGQDHSVVPDDRARWGSRRGTHEGEFPLA